jgi:hypothetical protein
MTGDESAGNLASRARSQRRARALPRTTAVPAEPAR